MPSLRSVEIVLDRPRHLLFTFTSLRDCCRQLGGISFVALLRKLDEFDLEAILQALFRGLRHEDKRLDLFQTEQLIEAYREREGQLTGVIRALSDAILASGMIPQREDGTAGEARPSDSA